MSKKPSQESHMHLQAKRVLYDQIIKAAKKTKSENKNVFGIFTWDSKGTEPYGVYEEFPMSPVNNYTSFWANVNWKKDELFKEGKDLSQKSVPTWEDLQKENIPVTCIPDIAIIENGRMKYAIEIIYKNSTDLKKKQFYAEHNIFAIGIRAEWVLRQNSRSEIKELRLEWCSKDKDYLSPKYKKKHIKGEVTMNEYELDVMSERLGEQVGQKHDEQMKEMEEKHQKQIKEIDEKYQNQINEMEERFRKIFDEGTKLHQISQAQPQLGPVNGVVVGIKDESGHEETMGVSIEEEEEEENTENNKPIKKREHSDKVKTAAKLIYMYENGIPLEDSLKKDKNDEKKEKIEEKINEYYDDLVCSIKFCNKLASKTINGDHPDALSSTVITDNISYYFISSHSHLVHFVFSDLERRYLSEQGMIDKFFISLANENYHHEEKWSPVNTLKRYIVGERTNGKSREDLLPHVIKALYWVYGIENPEPNNRWIHVEEGSPRFPSKEELEGHFKRISDVPCHEKEQVEEAIMA